MRFVVFRDPVRGSCILESFLLVLQCMVPCGGLSNVRFLGDPFQQAEFEGNR